MFYSLYPSGVLVLTTYFKGNMIIYQEVTLGGYAHLMCNPQHGQEKSFSNGAAIRG